MTPTPQSGRRWLVERVERGQPLVWCGYGLSLAVAEAMAAVCRARGAPSYALAPNEVQGRGRIAVAYLSRSARDPGCRVDLLVTASGGSRPAWADEVIPVGDPDGGADPWLPLSYAHIVVQELARALELRTAPLISPPRDLGVQPGLLLVERHSPVVRSVLRAATDKLGALPLDAMSSEELGHGMHSQLWRQPEHWVVWLISAVRDPSPTVRAWCEEVGVEVRELCLPDAGSDARYAIQLFDLALDVVASAAERQALSTTQSSLPAMLDELRSSHGSSRRG